LTLGQRDASAFASPLVIRRQLFPPKPSETDSVISFGPHHAGGPAAALELADADASVEAGALAAADGASADADAALLGAAVFEQADAMINTTTAAADSNQRLPLRTSS
jgi:hypothetical protein